VAAGRAELSAWILQLEILLARFQATLGDFLNFIFRSWPLYAGAKDEVWRKLSLQVSAHITRALYILFNICSYTRVISS
jgi:hypothetical protein